MGDGMLSLSWKNHISTFCHMLSMLRGTETYSDVTVACDGNFYEAHKLVLASCSDYFLKMFERTKCKHPIVVLKDMHAKDIEALLSYMYDGVVSVAQNDLARLINAAEVLQIKGLAVPDELPANNRKLMHNRDVSDDQSSPQQKRPRREESKGSIRRESSPLSSSRSDSSEQMMNTQYSSEASNTDRSKKEHETREHFDGRMKNLSFDHSHDKPSNKQLRGAENVQNRIKVMMDENEIKEEVYPENDNMQATEFEYTHTSQNSEIESIGSKELGNQDLRANFMSPSDQGFDSQAGPSGLQTWGGMHEGDLSNQSYSGEVNLDASGTEHTGSHQQHQLREWSNPETAEEGIQGLNIFYSSLQQQCSYCSFSSKSNESLIQHMSSHSEYIDKLRNYSDGKKYKCHYCPYTASTEYYLRVHTRTHTGEKPFGCPYCPTSFAQKSHLKYHILRHTGERPFQCTDCLATFNRQSSLKRHALIHNK